MQNNYHIICFINGTEHTLSHSESGMRFCIATDCAIPFRSAEYARLWWRVHWDKTDIPIATHIWVKGPRGGYYRYTSR